MEQGLVRVGSLAKEPPERRRGAHPEKPRPGQIDELALPRSKRRADKQVGEGREEARVEVGLARKRGKTVSERSVWRVGGQSADGALTKSGTRS